jgi:hypothetical protein
MAMLGVLGLLAPTALRAQHGGHPRAQPTTPDSAGPGHAHSAAPTPARPGMGAMAGHEHPATPAMFGRYALTREASGTSWQPEAAPHRGWHVASGDWSLMLHGFAHGIASRQGGTRGEDRFFGTSMVMGMATRPLGPGRLGLRAMGSLEPLTVGKRGYPLLLQTGETADGVAHLIDRQHPHDLFMELAASWSVADATRSAFVYAGLPGEPALGPPVFMHRASGEPNPESPIGHHWLDSTHIVFGVATLGVARGGLKLEASAFRGREPDENRWNIETPKLDSYSGRLSWNPTPHWALQASAGRLEGPEQLAPQVDTDRATASAMWSGRLGVGDVSALAAWGRNVNRPGRTTDAWLLEGAAEVGDRHTLFARAELVEKDELFHEDDPRAEEVFTVGRLAAGYIREGLRAGHVSMGIGTTGSISVVPEALKGVYGDTPLSASLFVRARLR